MAGPDYETGEGSDQFRYDVLTQGPVVGVGFGSEIDRRVNGPLDTVIGSFRTIQ
jgi:hypothetical protein